MVDKDRELAQIFEEYYYLTEAYDRSLPHFIHPKTQEAIVHGAYRGKSGTYAMRLWTKLNHIIIKDWKYRGISGVEIQYHKRATIYLKHEELERRYHSFDNYILTNGRVSYGQKES